MNTCASRLRHSFDLLKGHLALSRTRRTSIRAVAGTALSSRRRIAALAVTDLAWAISAHRLPIRGVGEFAGAAILPYLRRSAASRKFASEISGPPDTETENPLKGAREAAACLLTSERLRALQGNIITAAFTLWFGLKVNPVQAEVLGSYSDAAWLARGFMKSAGLAGGRDRLTGADRKRLKVVLNPYVKGLELRRTHLEGLSRPGRALLAAHVQKRRVWRLQRKGFSPDDLVVLYPDILDLEALRVRRKNIVRIRDRYLRRIEAAGESRKFENYLHLQTLVLGAPSRGPVRLGRYLAAVEHRHA